MDKPTEAELEAIAEQAKTRAPTSTQLKNRDLMGLKPQDVPDRPVPSILPISELTGMALVPDGGSCPDCRGLLADVPGVKEYVEWRRHFQGTPYCICQAKKRQEETRRWAEANLPRGKVKTFENFEDREGATAAYEAAQDFAVGLGPPILTLIGDVGRGKSHLAEAVVRQCLSQGARARYEHVGDMLGRLQEAINNPNMDMGMEINQCKWWEVLVLDDLGVQADTVWAVATLDKIVDSRYSNGKRTVITTNLTEAEMKRGPARRMADRIYDRNTGTTKVVIMECDSYRTGEKT